jgi:hypothetical protein
MAQAPHGVTLATGGDANIWMIANTGDVYAFILKRLLAAPRSLTFQKSGASQVLHVYYKGSPSELSATSLNPAVATVTRKGQTTFKVTSVGAGKVTIVIQDAEFNSTEVPVTVN